MAAIELPEARAWPVDGGESLIGVPVQMLIGAVVGYLLGMIPTGAVVGRALGVDLTQVGSKRTGATNVLRTLGVRWAIVVFVGDFVKGLLAVVITGWIVGGAGGDPERWAQVMAASFAVLGHTFSPLLGFRGGRGIVTGGGGLIVLSWEAFLVSLICGSTTVATTRYVSAGSLIGTIAAGSVVLIQVAFFDGPSAFWLYGTALPAFIILAHRDNIYRLATGTERKLSKGSRSQPPGQPAP
ncbi:MAG: glycerol-3-phosphate 1-O-acyltransferase PlsY [Chloroflexota bacterium]